MNEPTELALERVEPGAYSSSQTPAQAKIDAIATLTATAYSKASELVLNDEEIVELLADFPDNAFKTGASGKEHLIYIEHAFLRERLNQVFRPGQWAIVPRSRWEEKFTTAKGNEAVRVYVEAMLCIRGCFAAEAIGDMDYYPNNAGQNYGDAVEGAKSAALRRCCKELGIGLQAWKKDWCEGWWQRSGKAQSHPQPDSPRPSHKPATAPAAPRAPVEATPEQKAKFLAMVKPVEEAAILYAIGAGWIMPGESLADIGLENIPRTRMKFEAVMADIQKLVDGQDQIPGAEVQSSVEEPIEVPRDPSASWRRLVVPFGKNKGAKFGELEKNNLWWWCVKWQPTEYTANGKTYPPKASDLALRAILDAVREEYEFTDVQSSES